MICSSALSSSFRLSRVSPLSSSRGGTRSLAEKIVTQCSSASTRSIVLCYHIISIARGGGPTQAGVVSYKRVQSFARTYVRVDATTS
jgi:hypothetical protein